MNREASRASRAVHFAVLLGSASLPALAATAAQAQAAAEAAPVEEVLVTGSLIRGAPAVGVPVTALSAENFRETGALTATEMLRTVPALQVQETTSLARGGGTIGYGQSVSIHGFAPGSGVETLLLVDGMRWPVQGHGGDTVDPSIIPQLALDRVDVLAAGASAVYGSDAVAGVINVILKRGFEGAITQGQFGVSPDIGGQWFQASQLYGTKWATGGVTVSYEWYTRKHIRADARDYFTTNFERYGLSDQTPLANNVPAVITTASPATVANPFGFVAGTGTRFCANCFSMPKGVGWNYGDQAPGPTASWASILANPGVNNQRQPYLDSYLLPDQQRNAATITFDQKVVDGVSLFVDAFYSNRRAMTHYHATGSGNAAEFLSPSGGLVIPTNNPYRPSGVPAGTAVRAHYTFGAEMPNIIAGGEIATRWSTGFNFDDLPFDWRGKVFYSMTDDHNFAYGRNMINRNMVSAALGNTVPAVAASGSIPGQAAFTKPANIPYLNVLCDSSVYHQCNSPATLNYISAFRDQDERWQIAEWGANFDGPIFDLPGGMLQGALGAQKLSNHFHFYDIENRTSPNTALINNNRQFETQRVWALFGQLNIPVLGEGFTLPGVKSFLIEVGYRYDHYNVAGGVNTPKVAFNLDLEGDLTFRGAWGKSFRAPSFQEFSALSGTRVLGLNALGGGTGNSHVLDCVNPAGQTQGVALPGSLTALLNPTCNTSNAALFAPAGIQVTGGSGAAIPLRGSNNLGPETVKQWSVGLNYHPSDGFLSGLNVDVSYFNIHGDNLIGIDNSGTGPNDPLSRRRFIAIPNPALPITDPANASFLAIIDALAATGSAIFDPAIVPNVKFIEDNANTNVGFVDFTGIDFDTRYDWDMGDWGTWNIGAAGYYELDYRQQASPTAAVDERYKGKNSGARLKRVRGRLGWADNGWSVTGFARYYGHGEVNTNTVPPRCYWDDGFGPGSCYAGSPYNAQPGDTYGNRSPSMYLFDMNVEYDTGDKPANEYLHNLNFSLAVNNLLNKAPPFQFRDRGRGRDWVAFDVNYGELQRVVSFTITKNW